MKLFIMTDLEGVSGIVEWDCGAQGTPEQREYQRFLMTNEVNGAVEGAVRGGAKEVWVAEAHDIDIRRLHPDAMLHKIGPCSLTPALLGMTQGRWDAMAFIGNHAMAGPEGVLSHTQNLRVKNMRLNNKPVGEFGIQAAIAGDFGMPAIMVSGDDVACRQASELVPDLETAVVKYATSRFSAWCMTPDGARALIAAKMQKAVRRWRRIKPFVIPGPVTLREEMDDGMVREVTAPTVAEAFNRRCAVNT